MNRQEYNQLLAERSALEQLIAETPPEEVIDLRSFEGRLESVQLMLEGYPVDLRLPVKARLTYRGRPVVGSHGIFAEFGMAATKAFTDTVSMLAASLDVPLAAIGPIPNRRQNQLLITSTVGGSFGFELEEHRDEILPLEEDSAVVHALVQTQELLQSAATGSDDELTEAASGQDERVVAAVRTFLKTLIDNEAVCGISVKDKAFSFRDVGEVRRSWQRLDQDNLHEEPQTLEGVFEGALPLRRTFEFRVANTSKVIVGKIGAGVPEPAKINHHLYENTSIEVMATRVGQGQPRYVLNRLPNWPDPPPSPS
jgi:hypothetical protein